MARITVDELMKACQSSPSDTPADSPSETGLAWLRGTPSFAPDGSVALRLKDGSVVLVLAKDVVQVDRGDDDQFGAAVAVDTNVILAHASVRRAIEIAVGNDQACGCSDPSSIAARPFPGYTFGGCIGHCNALEGFCIGSGPSSPLFGGTTTIDALQDYLSHGARCRDVWNGCISRCFDATFSRS